MAILGIWGPFAVGKTTYINAFMCRQAGNQHFRNVVFVFADLSLEYHMDKHGQWRDKTLNGADDHWKGKQIDKEARIRDMVADDRYIWVIESARYFSGMYECLVDANQMSNGGMRFILPITDGHTMTIFMMERCAQRNKTFRADYWDERRVAYEANARYTNAAEKWFKPNGIPYEVVEIDKTRDTFYRVGGILTAWLSPGARESWYGMTDLIKQINAPFVASADSWGAELDLIWDGDEPKMTGVSIVRKGRH